MQHEFSDLVEAGINALGCGEPQKALSLLEHAAKISSSTTLESCLAYCVARERGQIKKGRSSCEKLIEKEPENFHHQLNLGRILLLDNDRSGAIAAFRAGIALEPHPHIIRELTLLGVRKEKPIAFLRRENILNRCLGRIWNR